MRRLFPVAVALLLAAPMAAATPPFTVDDILGSPFPSHLSAAPSGGHVSWVFNDRGRRNVWIASPPEYRGHQLTDFVLDDGQEITSLTWSPDARTLLFVRGGAPNAAGELPNPLHWADGVERSIWRIDLETKRVEQVTKGGSPLPRADNRTALFTRAGSLWQRDLAGDEAEDEQVASVRGGFSNLRLGPDDRRLLFVSNRGSHSLIGLLDLETRQIRFPDPSVDRDGSPVFSPDGSQIAYLRLPARADRLIFGPRRDGQPWSIRIVDLESGAARELFRADPGRGSVFRGVVARDQLVWTRDGHLVFPWERDGWTHLYSVATDGRGEVTLLTPGDGEVEFVAPTADADGVVFSSNRGDIDRRHLWAVAARGGPPVALTEGSGVENSPTPVSDGCCLAFVRADGRRPLQPAIRLADGAARDLAPGALPESFPLALTTTPEQVVFPATDGLLIHGQLFRPPASFARPRPAVVFFHGGSRRHMMLGWHYSGYYHNCYAFHQLMASRGYVVLSVNYRSGIGYGLEFREAIDYGATGASELRDVLGAGLYLRARDDVRDDAIGLWGGSYGGYLTAMGLTRASDLFAAGVDIHGVHDWNRTIKNFVPSYDPLEDAERARLAFESSPMGQVEDWRSPVLLIHGDDDRNVPFAETVTLVEKLRELGVEHELLVFPDEVHGFLLYRHWVEAFERASAFFERHLQPVARSLVTSTESLATADHSQ